MSSVLENLVNQPYRHGFVTDIESETVPKGLSEDTIRLISAKKSEPEWLLEFRLERVTYLHDGEVVTRTVAELLPDAWAL